MQSQVKLLVADLQLFPPHIAEQQAVDMVGGALDMLPPDACHQSAVQRQQHLRPVAHVLWKRREWEVNQESVAAPPACLHAAPMRGLM